MKEKERYEFKYDEKIMKHYIFDNLTKTQLGYEDITNLLNQQDKENQQLKQELEDSKEKLKEYATEITRRNTEQLDMQTRSFLKIRDLDTQILTLKNQLYDLPKKIVEEIKEELWKCQDLGNVIDNDLFISKIDIILKKYGGENDL